jgi:hypothetical protein
MKTEVALLVPLRSSSKGSAEEHPRKEIAGGVMRFASFSLAKFQTCLCQQGS